ncbi:hypothetical protein Bind_0678 [Beijerinckia indica subsp. indica ATCC 9039]|uniref:Uncharacterized protein n=1 Tax=Beijerinckia indica subsp. indica (strain ATCC 9039 / DSM 1715 / NCIMB 8712) TaxID=395963 RepID=B2IGE3_BEII9|nr:hypothetical protein Bind_0678 [Beijerinckia indica subsp. indica ATCC 9039]
MAAQKRHEDVFTGAGFAPNRHIRGKRTKRDRDGDGVPFSQRSGKSLIS